MMRTGRLELSLPPEPASVVEARGRVLDALQPLVGDGVLETLRLLVSEVVTNAVRHGDRRAPLAVRATWGDEVRIEVEDHGAGFSPAPRAGHLDEPGGFGLYLVGRLADSWGVETNDTTRVWFVLRHE